jgi:hypothetical protein
LLTAWIHIHVEVADPGDEVLQVSPDQRQSQQFPDEPWQAQHADVERELELCKRNLGGHELSNIQMMNGISRNMMAPLMRCMPDTRDASGHR